MMSLPAGHIRPYHSACNNRQACFAAEEDFAVYACWQEK